MGLLDIFMAKDKRDERSRQRNAKRAIDKFAQSGDRLKALEALAEDGSDDAFYAMLRRFAVMYDKTIEDEQEKEWVFETLCAQGERVIPAVKRYLAAAESVSWPLRILDKIAPKDQEIAILEDVLARHEPGYERDPTKKIQLLAHLGSLKDERAPGLVVGYLKDMDEGVRFTAAEALLRLGNQAVAARPLLDLFASPEEESLRLRLKIAEGFSEAGWSVDPDIADAVSKRLPDAYTLVQEGKGQDRTRKFRKKT